MHMLLCLPLIAFCFYASQVMVKAPDAEAARPPHALKDNGDGSFTVAFEAPVPGDYEISVLHQGKPVQGSTFIVPVGSNAPASQQPRYHPSVDSLYGALS